MNFLLITIISRLLIGLVSGPVMAEAVVGRHCTEITLTLAINAIYCEVEFGP